MYRHNVCLDGVPYGSLLVFETTENMKLGPLKESGKAFKCGRPDRKRKIQAVESKPAAVAAPEVEKRAELGACVDYCSGPNFTDKCTRNNCIWPNECVDDVDRGINLIGFGSGTYCTMYPQPDCKSDRSLFVSEITNNGADVAGWKHNTVASFKCARADDKREIKPGE